MPTYGCIRTSRDQGPGHPGSAPHVQRRQLVEAGVEASKIYANVAASGAKDYNSRDQWHVLDQQLALGDVLVACLPPRLENGRKRRFRGVHCGCVDVQVLHVLDDHLLRLQTPPSGRPRAGRRLSLPALVAQARGQQRLLLLGQLHQALGHVFSAPEHFRLAALGAGLVALHIDEQGYADDVGLALVGQPLADGVAQAHAGVVGL